MAGCNKDGFISRFGESPETIGYKPVQIQDEGGDVFECYLVEEEDAKPREIMVFYEGTCNKSEFWVHPIDHAAR